MKKFFKFFPALWFTICVLPLLGLLAMDQWHFAQFSDQHHQFITESTIKSAQKSFQQYLTNETQHTQNIIESIQDISLTQQQYQALLEAQAVMPLAKTPAQYQHLVRKAKAQNTIISEYNTYQPNQKSRAILVSVTAAPLKNSPLKGITIVRPVDMNKVLPHGPFQFYIFKGPKTAPQSLLYSRLDPFITTMEGAPDKNADSAHPEPPSMRPNAKNGEPSPRHVPPESPQHLAQWAAPPETEFSGMHHPSPPPQRPHEGVLGWLHFHPGPPGPTPGHPSIEQQLDALAHQPEASVKKMGIYDSHNQAIATLVVLDKMHNPGDDLPQKSLLLGFLLLLGGIFASLITAHYTQKNFFAPLQKLSTSMQHIKTGNMDATIDASRIRQPDVQETILNFNEMIQQLHEKEQLRKSFIANLTHDLKTPLIAQERTLEMLADEFESLNMQESAQLAKSLASNNEHLLTMISQLLDTYKYESGQLTLYKQPVALAKLVEECFEKLHPLTQEAHVTLQHKLPEDLPRIQADRDILVRVFINLIANAINSCSQNSSVTVFSRIVTPERIELHVKDDGSGIAEADQPYVFDRYYSSRQDTRKLGSGLGLYICKVFVEAHNGTITLDSKSGHYTDMIIELPISKS